MQIDAILGVDSTDYPHVAIVFLNPPGSFYKGEYNEDAVFVANYNWDSTLKNPHFDNQLCNSILEAPTLRNRSLFIHTSWLSTTTAFDGSPPPLLRAFALLIRFRIITRLPTGAAAEEPGHHRRPLLQEGQEAR